MEESTEKEKSVRSQKRSSAFWLKFGLTVVKNTKCSDSEGCGKQLECFGEQMKIIHHGWSQSNIPLYKLVNLSQ